MMKAHPYAQAKTYGEAIQEIGKQMDEIWENGNWSVLSCEATPLTTMAGEILTWEWKMEIEWYGSAVRKQNEFSYSDE